MVHNERALQHQTDVRLYSAAVRSSSVAGDPHSERLQCSLSPLSLLGMLKDLYAKYDAALGANPTVSTHIKRLAPKTPFLVSC